MVPSRRPLLSLASLSAPLVATISLGCKNSPNPGDPDSGGVCNVVCSYSDTELVTTGLETGPADTFDAGPVSSDDAPDTDTTGTEATGTDTGTSSTGTGTDTGAPGTSTGATGTDTGTSSTSGG
jgi:hypothetical protein